MKDGLFQFKRFSVAHTHSSMKVGVDAVLIGAWADCSGDSILDVGTGCGVIALMMAQRNKHASILGIDVDEGSVDEATLNFLHSDWKERLEAKHISFSNLIEEEDMRFDRIISNPPYFDSGIKDFTTSRIIARHQGELSPTELLRGGAIMLSDSGKLSMIVPSDFFEGLKVKGEMEGLWLERACFVRGKPRKYPKRVMMEFCKNEKAKELLIENMIMFDDNGLPTEEYRALTHDFYLKF